MVYHISDPADFFLFLTFLLPSEPRLGGRRRIKRERKIECRLFAQELYLHPQALLSGRVKLIPFAAAELRSTRLRSHTQ